MILHINLRDINETPIEIGSRVIGYPLNHEIIGRSTSHGFEVIEVDITRPRPVPDTPLFVGRVYWHDENLRLEVLIETEILVVPINPPSSVSMGVTYAFEVTH